MNSSEDTVTESAKRIVQDVHSAYLSLRSAVSSMIEDVDIPNGSEGWTTKEMVAHVAFWEEAAVAVIKGVFREGETSSFAFGSGYVPDPEHPWPVADVHNAREAQWARNQSANSVMDRWEAAHSQLVDILRTLTEEEISQHSEYFANLGGHLRRHLLELGDSAKAID